MPERRPKSPHNRGRRHQQPKAHNPWDNDDSDEHASHVSKEAEDFANDLNPDRDIVTTNVLAAVHFRSEVFAKANISHVSDYAEYRVIGWNAERAFTRVFGTDYADLHLYSRIEALEHNLVYRKIFAEKFAAVKMERMYGPKLAVYELLSLMNNPFTKCSTKLSAIKELNVLFGITVVDEAGRTTAGKTLKDFYGDNQPTPESKPKLSTTRHPEPGSAEAEAFVEANQRA
jgi:hypothetical protein